MNVENLNYSKNLYYYKVPVHFKNAQNCNTISQINNNLPETNQGKKSKINGKKIALIALGLGAVAAGILLFKKWNAKPVKELAEHIDFIKADNIDDAIKFAKDTLGVKLNVNGQLKTANWINESLVNLSNKAKGKVLLPKEIQVTKLINGFSGKYNPFTRTVKLSANKFGTAFERDFEKVKELGWLKGQLEVLYHEIGHGIHLTKSNMFNEFIGTSKIKILISPCKQELEKHLGGSYYTRCEGEAFPQLFAKKMSDGKLPDYAEKIWRSIGGMY